MNTDIPKWDGGSLNGELLLWAEQGIGDEIFYSSMLCLVPREGMAISVSADRRAHPIYERSFPGIRLLDRNIQNEPLEMRFAAQAPIGDLGDVSKVNADRIRQRRYPFLTVNQERRRELKSRNVFPMSGPVCGISWKSVNKKFGEEKSIGLQNLAPLLRTPGISFVNLQYGDVTQEIDDARKMLGMDVHQVEELDVFNDMDGLLALIDACDIILTTSNVTAHLAGSIGKKGVVLVPSGTGRIWYWQGEVRSTWYPSLRLVAQDNHSDWQKPIQQAAELIKESI